MLTYDTLISNTLHGNNLYQYNASTGADEICLPAAFLFLLSYFVARDIYHEPQ